MTNSAQNVSNDAVSGLNPLSYLNQNQPATVLRVAFPRTPTTADKRFKIGTMWLDTSSDSSYQLIRILNNEAQWAILGPGTTNLDQLDGDTGSATPTLGVINIVGGTGVTTTASGDTVTIDSAAGQASISEFIVAADGSADYTTIQAAITAASSGDAVFVRPGSYTEDLTLKAGVSVVGAGGAFGAAGVTITGTHTPPATGNVSFDSVTLADATTIVSSVAAGTGSVTFENCQINVTNGYCCDLVSWTGTLSWQNCGFGGTTDGVCNNTGGSDQNVGNSNMGAGSANSWSISGALDMEGNEVFCPMHLVTGATSTSIINCKILDPITLSNDSEGIIYNSSIISGASAAITMSSSGTWDLAELALDSSNDPCIAGAGAGVVTIGQLSFMNNANISLSLTVDATNREAPITEWVVSADGKGDYVTIQEALDACDAAGGGAVYIRPGTYTEDLTLYTAISMTGVEGNVDTGNVNIIGQHTPPVDNGVSTYFHLNFFNDDSIFFSAAAGESYMSFETCNFAISNPGYIFDMDAWVGPTGLFTGPAGVALTNSGDLSSAESGFLTNATGGMTVILLNSYIGSFTMAGTTPMVISGQLMTSLTDYYCPISITGGTGHFIEQCGLHEVGVTVAGASSGYVANCNFAGLTDAAFTMSSSADWFIGSSVIETSNTPAIDGAGAGVLTLAGVDFIDDSSIAATLTMGTGTSVSGTFATDAITAGSNLSGATWAADGSDTNIPLTLTPKGTGTVTVDSGGVLVTAGDIIDSHGAISGDVTIEVTNTDNTMADSRAGFEVTTGGTSAGDPYVNFLINGGQAFTMGIDNSTTNDDFVISDSSALGTSNVLSIDGSTSDVTVSTGNLIIGAVAKQLQMNGGAVTDFIGQATLDTGTENIANTNIAAGDRVFCTRSSLNSSSELGELVVTINAGASFDITSYDPSDASVATGDTSIVDYIIVRQN